METIILQINSMRFAAVVGYRLWSDRSWTTLLDVVWELQTSVIRGGHADEAINMGEIHSPSSIAWWLTEPMHNIKVQCWERICEGDRPLSLLVSSSNTVREVTPIEIQSTEKCAFNRCSFIREWIWRRITNLEDRVIVNFNLLTHGNLSTWSLINNFFILFKN